MERRSLNSTNFFNSGFLLKPPYPKVEVMTSVGQTTVRHKSAKQALNWNIARVLGGHPRSNDGAGVKVGIIDTGIDFNHPDLKGNIKGGINILNPSLPPQDDLGHGTHVAGIIGARHNQAGVVGVAPAVSLYAIKVQNRFGGGTLGTLVRGIEWGIQNGMHILNISLSTDGRIPPILRTTIHTAIRKGILVVAAAGNNGLATGIGNNVQVPGRIPGIVTVGALDRYNRRAPFSSTGPSLVIAAPGVNILSTYPNMRYAVLNGTSMAAPHVSGVAALIKQAYPYATPAQMVQTLCRHSIDLPPRGKDWYTGAGLVQRP